MRSLILLSLCLVFAMPAIAGKMYKWVDAQGRTQFSDQAPAGEYEEIRVRPSAGIDGARSSSGVNLVRIYTTAWCGVCKRAKAWFDNKGIRYTEYDVETSSTGRQEFARLKGKGVPIVLIGDQRMDGFGIARAEAMLKSAGY